MIWNFIQNQVLGMKWLNTVIGKGLVLTGLDTSAHTTHAVLIWLTIYPMMLKVDFRSIKNVGKNPKGLFVAWIADC